MKGEDNKFKIKTNAVNMPAGVFVFHTVATFFMGYEFCKAARRKATNEKLVRALKKAGWDVFSCEEEEDDPNDRTDEEQDN